MKTFDPMPLSFSVLARTGSSTAGEWILGSVGAVVLLVIAWAYWNSTRIRRRLTWFFGGTYRQLPVVSRTFSLLDIPNVRRAVEAIANENQAVLEILTVAAGNNLQSDKLTSASAQYRQMDIDVDEREDCLTNPLYLVSTRDRRWAILISGVYGYGAAQQPSMEVMSATRDQSSECIQSLRQLMRRQSIYRGKVISIEKQTQAFNDYEQPSGQAQTHVKFHRLPPVSGDAIILPSETMKRIDRNTVGFFRHAGRLKQQGHSTKRGLLFHGPPGTGKTRTACWLTHSLPSVTVFLVTGEQLWNIKECCELARELAPAMLILEDVDLIATRRDQSFQTTALHQLMNEMDGLDSDVEVLFLLTTNQPEQIEPALANRPGRIDQAIHFPMPDEGCRRRLVELYRGRSTLAITHWPNLLRKTDGSSPAFIKELVRKAALIAVEESETIDGSIAITDRHFDEAFHEMTTDDGKLTRRLTGFAPMAEAV